MTAIDPNAQLNFALDNVQTIIEQSQGNLPAELAVSLAQTQAILAVAFELRTLNQVLVYTAFDPDHPDRMLPSVPYNHLAELIKTRMPLR